MPNTYRWVAIAFLVALVTAASSRRDEPRPNILFVLVDDLGKEWIGCYGGEDVETPHIDALARSGMKFNKAYSMPQCTPSRVTLLTGKYPWRTGWVNHWDVPRWGVGYFDWNDPMNMTIAREMKQLGYRTCAAGKWQINDFRIEPQAMAKHGFEDWCMWTGYEAQVPASAARYWDPYVNTPEGSSTRKGAFGPDLFVEKLLSFTDEHREEPLFLYYPMALPHAPFVTTPDETGAEGPLARHKAMVRYIDKQVGLLVAGLEEAGLRENTYVIFTTDNGSTRSIVGTRDGRSVSGEKMGKLEAGVCQPFIVSRPGSVPEGLESDVLLDFSDLFPTFIQLAGGDVPKGSDLDGVSFAGALRGEPLTNQRSFIMSLGHGPARLDEKGVRGVADFAPRVLRDERFKVWVLEPGKIARLHDLKVDPWEETNLIESEVKAHVEARKKFAAIIAAQPSVDGRPRYGKRAANEWDLKPKAAAEK